MPITDPPTEELPTISIAEALDRLRRATELVSRADQVRDAARSRQDQAIRDALAARAGWKRVGEETGLMPRSVQLARDRARAGEAPPRRIARRGGDVDPPLADGQVQGVLRQLADL